MGADEDIRRTAADSSAGGDATGWFERLYARAEAGAAEVPWDRPEPAPLLVDWAARVRPDGTGRSAVVVGCGLGRDAEFVAGLGFATTAFDISPTAVRVAHGRHPGSRVTYLVADLLDPPARWRGRFDLVLESNTVQALPRTMRGPATAAVSALVAPGGTLLVLAGAAAADGDDPGPPWPLTRPEVAGFALGGLRAVSVERVAVPGDPLPSRWRAEFRRS